MSIRLSTRQSNDHRMACIRWVGDKRLTRAAIVTASLLDVEKNGVRLDTVVIVRGIARGDLISWSA